MSEREPHLHRDNHHDSRASGPSRRKLLQAAAALMPLGMIGPSGKDGLLAQEPASAAALGMFGRPHTDSAIRKSLRQHAADLAIFDTHEHIWHEDVRLQRKVDFFLLFSPYTVSDLVSAGMSPQLVRDLQNPEIPLQKRWESFAPYWPFTRTTGYGRCLLIAARDLFGVEDINEQTYRLLSERMIAANRPGWYEKVLKTRAHIDTCILDDLTTQRGQPLKPDARFFQIVTRFDYIVTAANRADLGYIEQVTGVAIQTLADLEKALEAAVEKGVRQGLVGIKTGLAYRRTLLFEKVARPDAERCFASLLRPSSSEQQDPAIRKPLEDYLMHKVIQQAAEHHLPVQIHTGFQNLNRNNVAWTHPSHLSDLLNEYRQVRFALFHGGYPYCSEFATLAKSLPNVHADLCWLHIITPTVAKRSLQELIETVPANKILGFGGDFFQVECAYAHAQMARAITAEALAEQVEDGYFKEEEAADLMERILYKNGRDLFSAH